MDKPLQTTLADVIRFLNESQVSYAMIGGLAASLRGEPRVTADVDLVLGVDVDRALELVVNLQGTPFQPLFSGVEEVVRKAFILPLRHTVTGVKVDMAIGLSGFERQVIARAEQTRVADCELALATAEDLLVMKLLAGRPRDVQDVHGIAMVQGERLDWQYCLKTATALGEAVDQDLVTQVQSLREEYGSGG